MTRPGLSDVPDLIESRAAGPRIVQTTISGHATRDLSVRGLREFKAIIATMERPRDGQRRFPEPNPSAVAR